MPLNEWIGARMALDAAPEIEIARFVAVIALLFLGSGFFITNRLQNVRSTNTGVFLVMRLIAAAIIVTLLLGIGTVYTSMTEAVITVLVDTHRGGPASIADPAATQIFRMGGTYAAWISSALIALVWGVGLEAVILFHKRRRRQRLALESLTTESDRTEIDREPEDIPDMTGTGAEHR